MMINSMIHVFLDHSYAEQLLMSNNSSHESRPTNIDVQAEFVYLLFGLCLTMFIYFGFKLTRILKWYWHRERRKQREE